MKIIQKFMALFLFLLLLMSLEAGPVLAMTEELVPQYKGGILSAGESIRLTATLNGKIAACTWTIDDEAVAQVISGNGTTGAVLQAVAPGETIIYASAGEGILSHCYTLTVLPTFNLMLEDGTPLLTEAEGAEKWVLVPEGADSIRLHLDFAGQVRDVYSDREFEPDAGSGGCDYTLSLNDTKLFGENLNLFLNGLNGRIIWGESSPDNAGQINYKKYKAGAYSQIYVKMGDGEQIEALKLYICWQEKLPVLETLSAAGAVFYTPLSVSDFNQQFILDKDSNQAVISFTATPDTAKVYLQDADFKMINNAVTEKKGIYSFTVRGADFGNAAKTTFYLTLENGKGYRQIITFTGARRLVDSPDAVVDYLCLGSQYSDGGNRLTGVYGLYPEKSLIGLGLWSTPISLGNFGGYITYYYEKPIQNDPRNPYGIDFIVYGNSNGGSGFSEPGNVLVSEDGETWYTLAGSEHYEDGARWNYKVVYERDENGFTVANGVSIYPHMYPSPENYPLHGWPEGAKESITVSGVRPFAGGAAGFPAFGYVDVRTNSSASWGTGEVTSVSGKAKNPYLPVTKLEQGLTGPSNIEEIYEGAGDCFDLAWAVDENGLPVEIDNIHYIKVQTASLTLATGGIGEKSTEVNVVARVMPDPSAMGVSAPPVGILVDGKALPLQAGVYEYSAFVKGAFSVEVEGSAASNVYINNLRASVRDFAFVPGKGVVRVIVQDGQKEPLIYYITVDGEPLTGQEVAAALEEAIIRSGAEAAASGPDVPLTRAMVVAALHELSGAPVYDLRVRGLQVDAWYTGAMAWAASTHIIKDTDTDQGYDPDGKITREQLATMLLRYGGVMGRDLSGPGDIRYKDAEKISSWALDAVDWAFGSGIIFLRAGGSIDPAGSVTKTEAAKILQRFFTELVRCVQ